MHSHNPADAVPIGPGSRQPASSHPRRPPPHKSVSLRHTPPLEWSNVQLRRVPTGRPSSPSPTGPRSDRANPPSSVSPNLRTHKQSSGESSDAGKWFERSNNNVTHDPSVIDNEPPFFLHNSSSSETPPEILEHQPSSGNMHATSMPYRLNGGAQIRRDDSDSGDYRSVIDDLTIVNKKLKQKLRRYEKMYDAHLQNDKLFEVRFHGLPDDKKKELEETLRKFAVGLSDSPSNNSGPSVFLPPILKNATSSLTSTRFAESGYASMSASGQNSVSVPSSQTVANSKKSVRPPLNQQHQIVQSYLHDMPAGFIGKPLHLTEKAKKKLVVRRLEQIFAGKLSAPGDHPHPVQQQEVSQSAARADREARELGGQRSGKEGIREARIMSEDEDMQASEDTSLDVARGPLSMALPEQNSSSSGSPDQRPTRPLDLDPYRAQVPSENMDYIRHLGFTPPDMVSGDAPLNGHGWIYLNLLINMAQLHTINVTSEFVKTAVTDYSSKFELSHDGRKIRWRGGHDVTRNSSDSSSEQLSSTSPDDSDDVQRRERKKAKSSHAHSGEITDPAHHARKLARHEKEREKNELAYTPLFFHQLSSEGDDEYNYDVDSSEYFPPMPVNATGESSGISFPAASSSHKRRDTGPIIFYNNAKFCTDLSGDLPGATRANPSSYQSIMSHPTGRTSAERDAELHHSKGPLADASFQLDEQMELDHSTSGESAIRFASESSEVDDDAIISPKRINFEASGLGGVQSVDNFAIDVQLRKKRVEHPHSLVAVRRSVSRPKPYPHRILEALKKVTIPGSTGTGGAARSMIASEIISAAHQDLPNSTLPPPSMLPFDSSSSNADSDAESDVSSAASDMSSQISIELHAHTAPQLLNISPPHDRSEQSWDPEDDDESDSVDLLATARALDPTAIYAREREYDSNVAERLAEEIPAGSSAATGVGGSGYNSPEPRAAADVAEGAAHAAACNSGDHLLSKNLKRARTSDNFAMLNPGKAAKFE